MSTFTIYDAVRKSAPITAAFIGPSGSGKTYSALLFARGLVGPGGRIGVIDTEGRRSLIYADDAQVGGYRHLEMGAPYTPERCIEALDAAVTDGWQAIVFDSASLEHDGEGGLLDLAEQEVERLEQEAAKRGRDNRAISQQKWTQPKLRHRRFLNHAVGLPAHVIMTFRQVLTTDFSAKPPVTVLSEVCEKNTKFSLELHATFSPDHIATWTRVPEPFRRHLPQGQRITTAMGAALSGAVEPQVEPVTRPAEPAPALSPNGPASPKMREAVMGWMEANGVTEGDLSDALARMGKTLSADWRTAMSLAQCQWILSDAGKAKLLTLIDAMDKDGTLL